MSSPKVPISAVFDVETKSIGDPYEIEASAVVIIRTDQPERILYFSEDDEMREAAEWLVASPHITTFNGKKFDVPVMRKYLSRAEGRKLRDKPHYDIFDEWVRWNKGGRISLENMAIHTLGKQKFENLKAGPIQQYIIGDQELLFQYNYWDTRLTYELLLHTVAFGYLFFKLPVVRKFYPETITRTN